MTICHSGGDETVLTGLVADQAALYGTISRLRDLGLQLISVDSKKTEPRGFYHPLGSVEITES